MVRPTEERENDLAGDHPEQIDHIDNALPFLMLLEVGLGDAQHFGHHGLDILEPEEGLE